jgi:hypothetical protein
MSGGVSFLLKAIHRPGGSDRRQLSSLSNAVINANGVLCVNSLDAEQVELSQMFARSRQGADERAVQRSTLERPYHRFAVLHPIARCARLRCFRSQGGRQPHRVLRRGVVYRACHERSAPDPPPTRLRNYSARRLSRLATDPTRPVSVHADSRPASCRIAASLPDTVCQLRRGHALRRTRTR